MDDSRGGPSTQEEEHQYVQVNPHQQDAVRRRRKGGSMDQDNTEDTGRTTATKIHSSIARVRGGIEHALQVRVLAASLFCSFVDFEEVHQCQSY